MSSFSDIPTLNTDAGVYLAKRLTSPDRLPLLVLGLFVTYFLSRYLLSSKDLPPGPTPIPFFGNAFQVPTEKSWLYFNALCKKYGPLESLFLNTQINLHSSGPIVRLNIAGSEMLLLNEVEDIDELVRCYAAGRLAFC